MRYNDPLAPLPGGGSTNQRQRHNGETGRISARFLCSVSAWTVVGLWESKGGGLEITWPWDGIDGPDGGAVWRALVGDLIRNGLKPDMMQKLRGLRLERELRDWGVPLLGDRKSTRLNSSHWE